MHELAQALSFAARRAHNARDDLSRAQRVLDAAHQEQARLVAAALRRARPDGEHLLVLEVDGEDPELRRICGWAPRPGSGDVQEKISQDSMSDAVLKQVRLRIDDIDALRREVANPVLHRRTDTRRDL